MSLATPQQTQTLTPEDILEHWPTQGALWLMEDPLLFENHKRLFILAIKKCGDLIEHQILLEDMAKLEQVEIRQTVASNPHVSIGILKHLAEDNHESVRLAVAKNVGATVSLLERLAKNANWKMQQMLAVHPALVALVNQAKQPSCQNLDELAQHWYLPVRIEVAKNAYTHHLLQQLTADKDKNVRKMVAHNSETSIDLIKQLAEDQEWVVRQAAEEHPKLLDLVNQAKQPSCQNLDELAQHWHSPVRLAVANNINTSITAFKKLAKDQDNNIRTAVASNIAAPMDTLQQLIEDEDRDTRHAAAKHHKLLDLVNQAKQPSCQNLDELAQHWYSPVRLAVANNINTSIAALQKLIEDKNSSVRLAVARHACLVSLVNQAQQPDCKNLHELAEFWYLPVRLGVAKNVNTSIILLQRLAEDEELSIRIAALNTLQYIQNLQNLQNLPK